MQTAIFEILASFELKRIQEEHNGSNRQRATIQKRLAQSQRENRTANKQFAQSKRKLVENASGRVGHKRLEVTTRVDSMCSRHIDQSSNANDKDKHVAKHSQQARTQNDHKQLDSNEHQIANE